MITSTSSNFKSVQGCKSLIHNILEGNNLRKYKKMEIIKRNFEYLNTHNVAILEGGRRSGKSYSIAQYLLLYCNNNPNTTVLIASMTLDNQRTGCYADFNMICKEEPYFNEVVHTTVNPRRNLFKNGSRIEYKVFEGSETTKGQAADIIYINEANNMPKETFDSLVYNVRKQIILDYNPTEQFWVDEVFPKEKYERLHSTFKDNPFITDLQKEQFQRIFEKYNSPFHTEYDEWNYMVNYLGLYAKKPSILFSGHSFTYKKLPLQNREWIGFLDPSALRGNDFYALSLIGRGEDGLYCEDLKQWNSHLQKKELTNYIQNLIEELDATFYVEVNGLINIKEYERLKALFPENIEPYFSRQNKMEKITSCVEAIEEMTFNPETKEIIEQYIIPFEETGHDDLIDALTTNIILHSNQ